ncbi:MAG TPA: M56 family metallopeptidase [Vicinamibacterales bacterium]|nr:M56 family metallopeptidase [Vicinamibacterales bacterium]
MDVIGNHIWESTIFGLVAAVLTLMFRRNSASARYWIWFTAAMKFLVPFAALAAIVETLPLPHAPAVASGAFDAATAVFRSSAIPTLRGTSSTVVTIVWVVGALIVLAKWAWEWRRLTIEARMSPRIVQGVVYETLRRVERAQGVGTPATIVSSSRAMEPGVLGIRKPVLIWPGHLTSGLSAAHIDAIVAHEVCHIIRRDNLLASAQMIVRAVFWFHPLVWLIGARLIDERERACDERVLALGGRATTYAESILETCRLCLASPAINVSGVTGGNLKTRINRIMNHVPAVPIGVGKKTALVLATLVMALAPIAGREAVQRNREIELRRSLRDIRTAVGAYRQTDQEVHKPGGRITTPRLVKEVKPQYTRRAMDEKIEGEVLMECVVKADGTVGDTKIVKPLDPDLDKAALEAATQWVFEPGTRDGKPVNVLVTIAMAFSLKKSAGK